MTFLGLNQPPIIYSDVFVHIHWECQLPGSYDSNMIECDRCNPRFHFKCVKLCKQVQETWYYK